MSKEEAIQAMKEGKKVTHRFFSSDEWMTIENGFLLLEDGVRISLEDFFNFRSDSLWDNGYNCITPHNMIDMNTTFEKSANTTDEWYTPKEIIDALGKFDLDPCAPVKPLWQTAETMYNKNHDGLTKDWVGRVWLNPPYSRPLIEQFVRKLAQHGNGIALLFNRCDSKMFQDIIFEKATAIKFLRGRIRFFRPDGIRGDSPGCGAVLIAFGEENAEILKTCNISGKYVRIN